MKVERGEKLSDFDSSTGRESQNDSEPETGNISDSELSSYMGSDNDAVDNRVRSESPSASDAAENSESDTSGLDQNVYPENYDSDNSVLDQVDAPAALYESIHEVDDLHFDNDEARQAYLSRNLREWGMYGVSTNKIYEFLTTVKPVISKAHP